ncbi:amino acid ABC transporter permease [Paraburkholderia sediminicola]|uniref:amino acid ABC transporter permease n=1 Tax=Paraburkholderia sediminicola TaxID=458836 RepID=UPI0038B851A3
MLDIFYENWHILLVGQFPEGPLGGLALTLLLSIFGLIISFPISILLALARLSSLRLFSVPATVFVYLIRGVPLIMLIFWSYFMVPLLLKHSVSGFTTLLCTLIAYTAAYLSEVVRAGILALPRGQTEASRALGLSYRQTTGSIILPQALYNMVPSLVTQFVSTIKDTSLGYVISVQELTYSANQVNNSLLTRPLAVFLTLAMMYFVVCFCLSQLANFLERRIERRRSGRPATARSYSNDSILQSE